MKTRKEIEYWGTGFPVNLLDFPAYEDDGALLPDVGPSQLARAIGFKILNRAALLSGKEARFLRSLADMTRSEAARQLGVTRRTLINWEEEGRKALKAQPLVHLGLRAFFFARIFVGENFPAPALEIGTKRSGVRTELTYDEMEERQGKAYVQPGSGRAPGGWLHSSLGDRERDSVNRR